MRSYWEDTGHETDFEGPLARPGSCDVVVVGAGFTGLAAAYYLVRGGASVMVLEARGVAHGASGRNGGQVLSGWPVEMVSLAEQLGREPAAMLWSVSEEALARVAGLVSEESIACDLERVGHLEAANTPKQVKHLQEELTFLKTLCNRSFEWWDQDKTAESVGTHIYRGGLFDPASMAFHPRNYALGLARAAAKHGASIHEGTLVTGVTPSGRGGFLISTSSGWAVSAEQVILATNAYLPPFAHWLRARILPVTSAQLAVELPDTEVLPRHMPTVSDSKAALNYYRRVGERTFLFGGRAMERETRDGRFPSLEGQLAELFPVLAAARITHQWAGRVALSADFIPHLGRLPDGVWSAAGYTGHGAALSTEMGFLLAEAVAGKTEDTRVRALRQIPWKRFPLGRMTGAILPAVLALLDFGRRHALARH